MKKILTYGTFDLLHHGHINILKKAKALGDYLIVGVSTDEFNKLKDKISYQTYDERVEVLEAIKYIDKIIPENSWDQKPLDVKKYDIDTFVMGDDWKGKFDNLDCNIVYLPRTKGISTTEIKKILNTKHH